MRFDKKYSGIIYAVIIGTFFILTALGARSFLDGVAWYIFSSIQRLVFGIVAIFIFYKVYDKKICQIFHFNNWKAALIAGSGFLIFFVYYVVTISLGIGKIVGLTMPLIVSRLFLQQITTGLYEEIVFRGLVLEGYFEQENKNWKQRLIYAFLSFILFGLIHIIDGDLYTFLFTGGVGFAFATIYLKSHNILIPMILHFVYDIFANLSGYIEYNNTEVFNRMNSIFYSMIVVMFIVSAVSLIKEKRPI